jgi:hypothetical protein
MDCLVLTWIKCKQIELWLAVVRRELRKVKSGLKVDVEEILNMLTNEVLKRDVIESEAATEAQKQ